MEDDMSKEKERNRELSIIRVEKGSERKQGNCSE